LRRALPIVGPVKEDYVFEEVNIGPDIDAPNKKIHMSEFFNNGKDSLVVYSFMYGEYFPKKMITNLSIPVPLIRRVRRAWVQPVETVRMPRSNPET
jgi:predicted dithiol-disulfide oxidoreductase (DUF899 family)